MKGNETRVVFYLHAASSQNIVTIKEKTNASTTTKTDVPAVEHRWLVGVLLFCLLSSGILAIAIGVGNTSSSLNTTELSDFSSSAAATTDTTTDATPSTASIIKIATIAAFVFLGLLLCLQLIDWYLGGAAAAVRHAWTRFTGAEDSEGLFHTQPYYLAVTRSTCEVRMRSSFCFSSRL